MDKDQDIEVKMLNRLLSIIYILLNKGTITAAELAQRFEVSVRTIYRDVETLSMAGIPIYAKKGKNGGICLTEQFVLDKIINSYESHVNELRLKILPELKKTVSSISSDDEIIIMKSFVKERTGILL